MWNYDREHEITMIRRTERMISAQCEVFDAVANFIVNRDPFDKQTLMDAMNYAVKRFHPSALLPEAMIAQCAARQVNYTRRRIEFERNQPKPVRRDRLGRPIQPKTDVVKYAYRPPA